MSIIKDKGVSLDSRSMHRSRLNSKHNSYRYQDSSMASEENQFIKAYNVSPQENNSFAYPEPKNTSYNTINVSKLSQHESPSPVKKKSMVEELTEKNAMLQKEVDRVERILNMGDNRKSKKLPEIVDGNLVQKQLQNAYKQIKFYEIDIAHREKMFEHEGSYVQKIRKAEKILIQRQQLVKKLQAEICEVKKQSNEYVKLLTDGHIKKEYANKTSRLHKEIKFYETQLKEEEDLQMSDYYNNEQKNMRIFEMEQKLINSGLDKGQLFTIKKQFQSKEKNKRSISSVSRVTSNDVTEDRSKKAFQSLKGQIITLKKMQKDYTKKIDLLENEKTEAQMRSMESKLLLQNAERDIFRMEEDFAFLKNNIDPNKLKPVIKKGSFTQSSVTQFKGKGNPLDHLYDIVQIGQFNKKSTPFNDRLVIGGKSAYIVELTFYQNRTQFLGFQAIYRMGDTFKKGSLNLLKRENERYLKDKNVKLEPGDFFKYFECAINKTNIITGFIAVSFNGKSIQAGQFDSVKKQLELNNRQYPCCLYGCYSFQGFQMIGIERVEPQ